MSYHVYTTSGIVLKRMPFGEANILLYLLTKDLGLINASARSARLFTSKLRSSLQEGALISVSCIKGKNGWKITNVVSNNSFYFDYPEYTHKVVFQIFRLLLKMIVGESSDSHIFEIVKSGLDELKNIEKSKIVDFEALMVLRVLNELGYVEINNDNKIFLDRKSDWGGNIIDALGNNRLKIIKTINNSLKESQL